MSGGEVAERLGAIRGRIAAASARAGRDPSKITLVGASKRQSVAKLQAAFEAGLTVFGENQVQEAREKKPHLPPRAEWHLLGPLQSNKVRPAAELFDVVHSLDRLKIARLLDREGRRLGRKIPCFVEVHLGGEETKHGFPPENLAATLAPLAALEHLEIVGLMTIPPPGEAPEDSRSWFRRLRELRDDLARRPEWQGFAGWLSMGMSDDFEVAVEEGATHVRIGTSLFGSRPPAG